jgi:hypothetical protein
VIHPDLAIKDLDYSGLVIQDLDFWGGRRAWLGCEEGKKKKRRIERYPTDQRKRHGILKRRQKMRKRRKPLHPLSFSAIAEVQTLPARSSGDERTSRGVEDGPRLPPAAADSGKPIH